MNKENQERMMRIYTGRELTLTSGAPSLRDVAVMLSRICRYAGGGQRFWPVSLHSMAVADMLPTELKVYGLLHDATEVALGDIPKPFKLDDTKEFELALEKRIYKSLGLPNPTVAMHKAVKEADFRILCGEVWLFGPKGMTADFPRDIEAEKIIRPYLGMPPSECIRANGKAVKLFYGRLTREVRKAKKKGAGHGV